MLFFLPPQNHRGDTWWLCITTKELGEFTAWIESHHEHMLSCQGGEASHHPLLQFSANEGWEMALVRIRPGRAILAYPARTYKDIQDRGRLHLPTVSALKFFSITRTWFSGSLAIRVLSQFPAYVPRSVFQKACTGSPMSSYFTSKNSGLNKNCYHH